MNTARQQEGSVANSQGQSQQSRPPSNFNRSGRSQTNVRGDKRCFQCGKFGHLMYSCPDIPGQVTKPALSGRETCSTGCNEVTWNQGSQKYLRRGTLNGKSVQMLIDTGCTKTMVSTKYLHSNCLDHINTEEILCVHGDKVRYPTAEVKLGLGQWSQVARVVAAPDIPVPVLLGTDIYELTLINPVMVTTRAQARRGRNGTEETTEKTTLDLGVASSETSAKDVSNGECGKAIMEKKGTEQRREEVSTSTSKELNPLEANADNMRQWQATDPTLAKARDGAKEEESDDRVGFYYHNGLLYRNWRPEGTAAGDVRTCRQLVLPWQCRQAMLQLAHDVPMAGHMGITRTKDRLLQRYYWPGVFTDTANYCRSCEVCQKSNSKCPTRAKMVSMPLIEQPFQRIAMDVVGPLPRTQRGNRFILTICDYATRYPEAIALPSVEAPRVAKELVNLFSHVGIPDEILTDQGTNFMSTMMEEICRMLHIKRIRTTPYHPQTDGLVERFNGTLKSMLKKFVNRSQKDWDEYLPYLLFAYREVPQETTGFSPFELLYGRCVRGPLDVLREDWTGDKETAVPVATHIIEMREQLAKMTELVAKHATMSQERQKQQYDKNAKARSFQTGDQVLVLLPVAANRLKLQWTGPYRVTRKVGAVDYEIEMPGRRQEKKIYHVNLMKKWHVTPSQPHVQAVSLAIDPEGPVGEVHVNSTDHELAEYLEEVSWSGPSDEQFFPLKVSGVQELKLDMKESKKGQLQEVLASFPQVLANTPGRTNLVQHHISAGDATPIQQKPYRVPYAQRDLVKQELDRMLQANVIRPSTSPWASPIVLVPKKDGSVRFCVDYRKLNQVAKFDAYPMPRMEELIDTIGPAGVITTLDLAKGYWQIPMDEESKDKTAFTTPFGLYEFEVMPFGLHSAPATFQRMINHALRNCWPFARAYIDDIVIFSTSWEEHLVHLREVFTCLQTAKLTIKVSKCQFGRKEVRYLGHVIGGGTVRPDPQKIEAVNNYPQPGSKKEVRAFLGLAGYYRRFVPHFATIAEPLTELTKGSHKLKELLSTPPILKVAEPNKQYVLQTDASEQGLGAVLSQVGENGEEHPVAFASRKFLPREKNYSVIEKECLAIVWSLQVFHVYLYGQKFSIETDHQPLSWLGRMKNNNQRLTRWALSIQPYCFEMRHRSGSSNNNADGLSRGPLQVEGLAMAVTTSSPSH